MFLQSHVMRQPMLASVRTLVDRIPHRTGIDRRREQWVNRERRHPARAETRKSLPSPTAITGLVNGIIRGHVEDLRVRRMERDRHDRLALLLAAIRTESNDQKAEAEQRKL